jgi:hypothetical protein
MTFLFSNKRSPKLKASIIEPILILCINGISIYELPIEIKGMSPLPCRTLKKYLFYLINCELVSCNGQRQICMTEDGGLDLLNNIHQEKQKTLITNDDITITID